MTEVAQEVEPFDPSHYVEHVPEIERRIEHLRPHVIVCGLGPSAWMLRRVRPEVLAGIRLWGVNDFWKIMPCHDLTIMDQPIRELDPRSPRYRTVVQSKPERWWLYQKCAPTWAGKLHEAPTRTFELRLWKPHGKKDKVPMLQANPFNHTISSPVGTTAIAWGEGLRRIGIIGVDMLQGQHRLSDFAKWINFFLGHFGDQARQLGGEIVNLSPFSRIKSIQPQCALSTSGSDPTSGSMQPEPSKP